MQKRDLEPQVTYTEVPNGGHSQNNLMIDLANLLSIFGLIFGCFVTYQLLTPQHIINTTAHGVQPMIASPSQSNAT